jgi:hypothetical protein
MSEGPVTFPVSAGILEAKHVAQMPGQSLFVYLWFLNRVTSDAEGIDGQYCGAVLGGQPVNLGRVAEELGMILRTVRRYVGELVGHGYLTSKKTGSGACIYGLTKSKKWCWQRNSDAALKSAPVKESADSRHGPTRALIQQLFQSQFSVACNWDGSEARALQVLLKNNPSWTAPQIENMVRNRFLSDGIASDRPRVWLPNLAKYHTAPLDRFQKPKSGNVRPPVGQGAMTNYEKLLADSGVSEAAK